MERPCSGLHNSIILVFLNIYVWDIPVNSVASMYMIQVREEWNSILPDLGKWCWAKTSRVSPLLVKSFLITNLILCIQHHLSHVYVEALYKVHTALPIAWEFIDRNSAQDKSLGRVTDVNQVWGSGFGLTLR